MTLTIYTKTTKNRPHTFAAARIINCLADSSQMAGIVTTQCISVSFILRSRTSKWSLKNRMVSANTVMAGKGVPCSSFIIMFFFNFCNVDNKCTFETLIYTYMYLVFEFKNVTIKIVRRLTSSWMNNVYNNLEQIIKWL